MNHPRQSEADKLILFMADLGLQLISPRGTITFSARGSGSTIDLIFASEHLVNKLGRPNMSISRLCEIRKRSIRMIFWRILKIFVRPPNI